jgi:hypothetical protein
MSFSLSTFTAEINRRSTIAFKAKWQAEAGEICRGWINLHWDEITKEQVGGVAIPLAIKVRLASASERARFEAAGDDVDFYGDVEIVRLIDARPHKDEAGGTSVIESEGSVAEQDDAHDDDDDDGRNVS